jgi:hypothetical protein
MPLVTIKDCLNCNTDHEWLFEGLSLKELRMIKKLTGMSQRAFAEAGDEGDPDALAALIYVLHVRDRIKVPFDEVDLDFSKFTMEPTEQELKEAEEMVSEQDEDPKEEGLGVENLSGL